MHGIELSAHFTLWRYTFSKCQQADIESSVDKLLFETIFIISNDGCIFSLFRPIWISYTRLSSGRGPYEEHLYEIIFNFGQQFKSRCRLKNFFLS